MQLVNPISKNKLMTISDKIQYQLYNRAKAVMQKAYAPYSKFKVGAAIYDENGNYHVGCNVENAAYPIGNCAEASAISAMIASNGNKIIAISVTGYGDLLCTPCGGCRQRRVYVDWSAWRYCSPPRVSDLCDLFTLVLILEFLF